MAVSDPERRVALPAGTISVRGAPHDLRAVAAMVRERGATAVVVGHPLAMTGGRGEGARRAEEFAAGLRAVLGDIPVHLQDERLSTAEAERGLEEAGATGHDRRRASDAAAAAIILGSFLARSAAR